MRQLARLDRRGYSAGRRHGRGTARAWRRIAAEEAFWTPKLAGLNRSLSQTLWADLGIVGWTTDPANETCQRLISFEGEGRRSTFIPGRRSGPGPAHLIWSSR